MTQRETAPHLVREQIQAVDSILHEDLETWSRLELAVADLTFDLAQQSLRANLELLPTYRQMYQDGFKTWQRWLGLVGETMMMPARSFYTPSNGATKR